jgi:hypothetical protein
MVYEFDITPNSFNPTYESIFTVYLSTHSILTVNIAPSKSFKVKKAVQHEDYDDRYVLNDIAILILAQEVKFDHYTQIACLPKYKLDIYPTAVDMDAFIVGYIEKRKFHN